MAKAKVKERVNWPVTILLIVGLITIVFPLYMAVVIAFKDPSEMTNDIAGILSLPSTWSLDNFIEAMRVTDFFRSFMNSLIITVAAVVVSILVHSLAAYAIGRNMDRKKTSRFFRWAQVASGAGVAFMHGAQDGQKFMSIFVLAITLATGVGQADQMILPIWLMFFCALNMGLGTAVGGERIIKSVGLDMVKLEPFQGFAASVATFFCLMLSTFAGLPVSTTHTNTTAIMGVGAAKRKSAVKWGIAIDMVKTWVLTFPGCGLLGFAFAHLFLMFS